MPDAAPASFTLTGTVSSIVVDYADSGTAPDVRPVSAIVDIIPRNVGGRVLWSQTLDPHRGIVIAPVRCRLGGADGKLRTIISPAAQVEIQRVKVTGASGGTFSLGLPWAGQPVPTTGPIAITADGYAVETALNTLPTIGANGVTVVKPSTLEWRVFFYGSLAGQALPLMTAQSSLAPAAAKVVVTRDQAGAATDGVELVACTADLPVDELIYDVVFSRVRYNGADQVLQPFAFRAPTEAGVTVDLAELELLPPKPGIKPIRA